MSKLKETQQSSEKIFSGKLIDLYFDHIELPNGKSSTRGYSAGKLTFLTNIHPAIGFSNEKMWMYLAEDLILSKQNLDQDEFLELYPLPVDEAIDLISQGKITDVKTVIGILWLEKFLS